MRDRVIKAITHIEHNGGIEKLRDCLGMKQRYDELRRLLDELEIKDWNLIAAKQLVVYLHRKHELDFGVCRLYQVDDHRQYCLYGQKSFECNCVIPQPSCVFRDQGGKPKYPEFLSSQTQQLTS